MKKIENVFFQVRSTSEWFNYHCRIEMIYNMVYSPTNLSAILQVRSQHWPFDLKLIKVIFWHSLIRLWPFTCHTVLDNFQNVLIQSQILCCGMKKNTPKAMQS